MSDSKANKKNPFSGFADSCKEFGKNFVDFWVNFGHGFVNFFKDPKTGFKNLGKFLKTQNGWLFILPAVILMCVFTFYPIVNSLVSAFKIDYQGMTRAYKGWGFANFSNVIKF